MRNVSRILVAVDPTSVEQPALARAADVAAAFGAVLELLICYHDEYLSGDRVIDGPSLRSARTDTIAAQKAKLEDLAKPLQARGMTVETSAIWRHPLFEGIVWHSVQSNADLVFKDTHHHDVLARSLFTNTDWSLIRTCPVPLWLVKRGVAMDSGAILAAIDPMHQHDKPAALDDRILETSAELAGKLGLDLHVFHSYDPRTAEATIVGNAYIPTSLPFREVEDAIRAQHANRLDELATYHGIAADHCHLIAGLAYQELPDLARSLPADLVVMGAVARNRLERLFIGATAEKTLEHLPCDLLVIKPEWFRSAANPAGPVDSP